MSNATSSITEHYRQRFPLSEQLYRRGCDLFPSGVTHDSRHLRPFPVYVNRSAGSRKWTQEGMELIDYWSGHGALLLGHGHPAIVEAVQHQVSEGTHWAACHELELQWGELVQQLVPCAERLRFTSSGTEATLMALRLARIVTGRTKTLKFNGHFHGWHDQLIPGADSPHQPLAKSVSGITESTLGDLVIAPPNDLEAAEQAIAEHQPACVILEPTGGHWGRVPIRGEFLQGLRELTTKAGVLLIFDEVITGFRVHPGGAQAHYGVTPDLTTLAKVLAGGLPGGCLAGRADCLEPLAFDNSLGKKMPHHGTYNANPLSAAAGIAGLKLVATGEPSNHANQMAAKLRQSLNELFQEQQAPFMAYGDFSTIKILPGYREAAPDSDDFLPYNNDHMKLEPSVPKEFPHAFRCALLTGGVDWMGFGGMTTWAHTIEDVQQTRDGFAHALALLKQDGWFDRL